MDDPGPWHREADEPNHLEIHRLLVGDPQGFDVDLAQDAMIIFRGLGQKIAILGIRSEALQDVRPRQKLSSPPAATSR